MKRVLIPIPILAWVALVFLASSCTKTPLFESSVTNVSASYFSAEIHLNANVENWDGDYKLGIELWAENHNRDTYYSSSHSSGVIRLSALSPATTYNYKVFIEADNVYYGESGTFKTKSLDKVSFGATSVESCTLDNAIIRSSITIPASYSETDVVAGLLYTENPEDFNLRYDYTYRGELDDIYWFSIGECHSITLPHFQGSVIEVSLNNRSDIVDHNGDGVTYYYRPFVFLPGILDSNWEDALQMGETQSVTLPGLPEINGYRYVDLGLESGLLWAICDVGATTPLEQGDKFQWAGTTPTTNSSSVTAPFLSSYQVGVNWVPHIYKYNFQSDYGNCDNVSKLEEKDDAATVNYGAPWRMPTKNEFEELISSCTFSWLGERYKVTGPNGHYIYLFRNPEAEDTAAIYWSSSLFTSRSEYAWRLSLPYWGKAEVTVKGQYQFRGYLGHVRPVISRDQIQQ